VHHQTPRDSIGKTSQGVALGLIWAGDPSPKPAEWWNFWIMWEAMTRRSLAFDACGIIDYEVFQKWVTYMFQVMREPAPPGFKQPGVTQLLRTDRQAFAPTRDSIKPKPDGTRPLDSILEDMAQDHTAMFFLLPTVAPSGSKPDKPKPKAKAAARDGHQHGGDEGPTRKKPKQQQWKQYQEVGSCRQLGEAFGFEGMCCKPA